MKGKDIRILVADDDDEDRLLLKDTFDELGYGGFIHFEENGEKAIQHLQQCLTEGCLPCLLVVDLNMPKLNGRETLRYVKSSEAFRHISVIIYSTSLNPIERDECLALGAASYVVKPVTYQESIQIANNFYDFCMAKSTGS